MISRSPTTRSVLTVLCGKNSSHLLEVVGFKLNEQHLCEPFPFRKIPKLVFRCCVCWGSGESSSKSSCQATLQIHMKTITQWSTPGISHCAHFLHIWKLGLAQIPQRQLTRHNGSVLGMLLVQLENSLFWTTWWKYLFALVNACHRFCWFHFN